MAKTNPTGISEFRTLRDFLRYAVTRFNEAALAYGHGTSNALDEAAFLLLEALHLPIDQLDPFLDARLTEKECGRLAELIDARIVTRKPAAYLLGRAYIRGVPFHVDERVIVPRSFIGELLFTDLFAGDGTAIATAGSVGKILDLCTGSACLAILAAQVFPEAEVHAVEISGAAIEVARRNVAESGHAHRITLFEGDLFAPVGNARYDLILANPPYVSDAAMQALPAEYRHEPPLALAGGHDGLDIVRRILAQSRKHLADAGALVCEIGAGRAILEAEFPKLPFTWLDTEASAGEVFCLRAADFALNPPPPAPPRGGRNARGIRRGSSLRARRSGARRAPT